MTLNTKWESEMSISRIGKLAVLVLLAPVLFVWEVVVWIAQQLVKADRALNRPLESLTEWSER